MNTNSIYTHALALATAAVGQIVAYVPSWRPEAQGIISGGAVLLALGMYGYQAVTHRTQVIAGATTAVKVAKPDIEAAVRTELSRLFGGAATPPQTAPASAPAPTTVTAPNPTPAPPTTAP
jgi:hypothetical protein